MEMASAFTLNVRLDNIAIITIDVPGEKMNTLKAEFASQVRAIIKQLRENKELRGVVFVSAKPDNFIAGADINMIGNCKTAQEAEVLARQGQQLMAEIHALPIPVIAAIHGACLGGGLELALACHGRVCTDDPKTVLGLPEVQLGLLPGSGGSGTWDHAGIFRYPAFTAPDRCQHSIRDDPHRKTTSGETGGKAGVGG